MHKLNSYRYIFFILFYLQNKITCSVNNQNHNTLNIVLKKNLTNHTNLINSLKISKNNKFIVTGGWDGLINISNIKTGKLIQRFNINNKNLYKHFITSLDISKDDNLILVGSSDHNSTIWNIQSRKKKYTLEGHTDFITSAVFSNNNKFIVTSSYDYHIIVWTKTGKIKFKLKHPNVVKYFALSKDDKFIVSASNNFAYIWDTKTGIRKNILIGANVDITSLDISPNCKSIVIGYKDGTIIIWDVNSGHHIPLLKYHQNYINKIRFSPNNKYIVSVSVDLTIGIWNAINGIKKYWTNEPDQKYIYDIDISNDSKYILMGSSDRIQIWNSETGKMIWKKHFDDPINKISFSSNNNLIAASSKNKTFLLGLTN